MLRCLRHFFNSLERAAERGHCLAHEEIHLERLEQLCSPDDVELQQAIGKVKKDMVDIEEEAKGYGFVQHFVYDVEYHALQPVPDFFPKRYED